MTKPKARRKRGRILCDKGWKKIWDAIYKKFPNGHTIQAISELTDPGINLESVCFVSTDTVSNILNRRAADKGKIECLFTAFGLKLDEDDHNIQQQEKSEDFYVERPAIESRCYEILLQPGSLIRLKAPSRTGKTSLMTRVLTQLENHKYRAVHLSFNLADSRIHFTNLNKFLRWFCSNISQELGLPRQLDEYWDEEGMGSKVSCTTYFEEYLLAQSDRPLALCLDNVDLLFQYPEISEDFFALLRSWHEKARSRDSWKKLRLVIVHSTNDYISLNIHLSPFNVGVPIELTEFTSEQVQDLAKQYGLDVDMAIIEPLMKMVGGHPYLLQQAFSHLKNHPDITLAQLLAMAPTEAGIYINHLREHLLTLQKYSELATAFKKVVTANTSVQLDSMHIYDLQSMGLIELQGNEVMPRCNLYRQYFCERLGNI